MSRLALLKNQPLAVIIIGFVMLAAGLVGVLYHATELRTNEAIRYDVLWVLLVRALAIVAGVFLLLGKYWARWLTLAWMAFHVVVSMFHSVTEVLLHAAFLIVLAYFLLRPARTQS